ALVRTSGPRSSASSAATIADSRTPGERHGSHVAAGSGTSPVPEPGTDSPGPRRQGRLSGSSETVPGAGTRRLTVLSGPSGVGKSTVVAEIRHKHPEVWLSVSVTTRAPRPGEVHGVQYFFVDDAGFDRLVAEGELLEWAEFAGNRYGTPRGAVEEKLAAGVPTLL